MKLLAIPNTNDKELFDLMEDGTTKTVWACIQRDIFYLKNRDIYDALGRRETIELELVVVSR